MKKILLLVLISLNAFAQDITGVWRGEFPTVIGQMPFNLKFEKTGGKLMAYSLNAEEKIPFDEARISGDSLFLRMELYDAEIHAKIEGDKMTGYFKKKPYNAPLRQANFVAQKNDSGRFLNPSPSKKNITGKYLVKFFDGKNTDEVVGVFEQKGSEVTGSFLTPTGDYRFLQGNTRNDSLLLSGLDGNHVYLFSAKIKGDSLVGGRFCSSFTVTEDWTAVLDPKAELPDAEKLTYLKPGFNSVDFSFKDTKGNTISSTDERFKNKVLVLQIMGSWCPNCMDETQFMTQFYKKYNKKGFEVVGLSFERTDDPVIAHPKINRMVERFKIQYPVVLAGKTSDNDPSKKLPMLNKVMGFPTTIIIDKKGVVRKIHTGFSGPGTGVYYEKYIAEFENFINKLIKE